jgi:thymidylate synthase
MNSSTNEAWLHTVGYVLKHGDPVIINCADGKTRDTTEAIGETIVCSMNEPVVTFTKRKLGYRFMAAEAAWILSGSDSTAGLIEYNKNLLNYSDDGLTFYGAYGPRIKDQLAYVVNALAQDPSSRRAVLTLWRQNPPATKDTPCTLSAQFLIREEKLHCVVTMRSSDTWMGLPYDIFAFSMLAATVFLKLRTQGVQLKGLGNLVNFAGSRHLYQQDIDKINELNFLEDPGATDELTKKVLFNVHNYKDDQELFIHLQSLASGHKPGLKDGFLTDLPHFNENKS